MIGVLSYNDNVLGYVQRGKASKSPYDERGQR